MSQRVQVQLRREAHRLARIRAAESGQTLTAWLSDTVTKAATTDQRQPAELEHGNSARRDGAPFFGRDTNA